jgi:hydroxyethylthiazole kinase
MKRAAKNRPVEARTRMITVRDVWRDLEKIRADAPLVHNITNYVVMNTTANALLSLGASPVMAHAVDEVEEMVGLASALVINIGTLSAPWVEAMFKAAGAARRKGIPLVVDPVGAGATGLRTETARRLLVEGRPTIVRGNGSEIRALLEAKGETKGVDSRHDAEAALDAARTISQAQGCAISISGPVDVIVRDRDVIRVANGHPMMAKVTGLGCTATALTGAFAAVNPDALRAAAHAMAVMGIAGEIAAGRASGPGSFQMHFLDALYLLDEDDIGSRLRVESV